MCVLAWMGSNCNKGKSTQNEKNKERMGLKWVQHTTKDHQSREGVTPSAFNLQQKTTNNLNLTFARS
jgi:hypothetical protein